jgi:hypothetical protein
MKKPRQLSNPKNAIEIHKPHTVRPEMFVIEVGRPEGTRPQRSRHSQDRREAEFIARPLSRKRC